MQVVSKPRDWVDRIFRAGFCSYSAHSRRACANWISSSRDNPQSRRTVAADRCSSRSGRASRDSAAWWRPAERRNKVPAMLHRHAGFGQAAADVVRLCKGRIVIPADQRLVEAVEVSRPCPQARDRGCPRCRRWPEHTRRKSRHAGAAAPAGRSSRPGNFRPRSPFRRESRRPVSRYRSWRSAERPLTRGVERKLTSLSRKTQPVTNPGGLSSLNATGPPFANGAAPQMTGPYLGLAPHSRRAMLCAWCACTGNERVRSVMSGLGFIALRTRRSGDGELQHSGFLSRPIFARLHEIREAAYKPVFQSFRQIVGATIARAALSDLEQEQAELLDKICARESEHDVFVVEDGRRFVAFCSVTLDRKSKVGEIDLNAVHPDYQGRGIARECMILRWTTCGQPGWRVATVGTGGDPSHAPARRAYEKAGFAVAIPSVYLYRSL